MFSLTCSTRVAPVITVLTCGLRTHQASASWASVQPSSSATALQPADDGVLGRIGETVAQERVAFERAARSGRNSASVFARQQARGERAPGRQAESDVLVKPRVLLLDTLAMEQVVLRLLHHRLVQVAPIRDVPRGADLVRVPFARAPVERLAALDDVVHRPDRLLDRRVSDRRDGSRRGRRSRAAGASMNRRWHRAGTCGSACCCHWHRCACPSRTWSTRSI